jgi:hypothetical protein
MQTLAEKVEQRDARVIKLDVPPHAVHGEADGEAHAGLRSMVWVKLNRVPLAPTSGRVHVAWRSGYTEASSVSQGRRNQGWMPEGAADFSERSCSNKEMKRDSIQLHQIVI